MDRETHDMFERIEIQLKRIAFAVEIYVANDAGAVLTTACVTCGCTMFRPDAPKCIVCGTRRKEG